MADPRSLDPKASEPGISEYTRDVYGTLLNRIFPREEAMYSVQCSLPGRRDSNLL